MKPHVLWALSITLASLALGIDLYAINNFRDRIATYHEQIQMLKTERDEARAELAKVTAQCVTDGRLNQGPSDVRNWKKIRLPTAK